MAKQTINAPANRSMPLNTGDSAERGDTAKDMIGKINDMFTELYAALGSFVATPEAVTFDRPVVLKDYTVATLPAPVAYGIIYVSDGAAGAPILAFSDGTDWLRSDTGAAVAGA